MKASSPSILAPAGNKASFLAALAAGADAVYCGLKQMSARMTAQNFTVQELAALARLAHHQGTKVFVTINTLLRSDELESAAKLVDTLNRSVHPDALIIQDLSLVQLSRDLGFTGDLIVSTLANVTSPAALRLLSDRIGINGVVIPRELNIDEIKTMARACPKDLFLEVFVHGALCYGVSGRCYWSSYLGGKSGLRGRCVQPCRRLYRQNDAKQRGFSCQDLSLDVLAKVLLDIPQIRTWKIEGRKKGPHYVYYTVSAYKTMRDHGKDPNAKKEALGLLERSLGRKGTHYLFLPQRPQNPMAADGQTGSGLLVGRIQGGVKGLHMVPREDLLPGDLLRIGYEEEKWHEVLTLSRYVPKRGRFNLKLKSKAMPPKGAPIFLIDRREKVLIEMIDTLDKQLVESTIATTGKFEYKSRIPKPAPTTGSTLQMDVHRRYPLKIQPHRTGCWLSKKSHPKTRRTAGDNLWWWLPPVIWPDEAEDWKSAIRDIIKTKATNIVLNAPWQLACFKSINRLNLWAGPFCNVTNSLAISALGRLGFKGVIVSPELGESDILKLPRKSPLPLGIIISGNWPLCISRILSDEVKIDTPFESPKGESAWVTRYDSNYWLFPNWIIDLKKKRTALEKAGYRLFIHLKEPIPRKMQMKQRQGLWNWRLGLS